MKKIFLITIMMLLCGCVCVGESAEASKESDCVDLLVENNILRGDEGGLRLDDAITYGEYATLLNRVYYQDLCSKVDEQIGGDVFRSWEEASLYVSRDYMREEIRQAVSDKFYEYISIEDMKKMTAELFALSGDMRRTADQLLAWHGVDMSVFSYEGDKVTRGYACEVINSIFYKDFAKVGGYIYTEIVYCYTPQGLCKRFVLDVTKRKYNSYYPWDIIDVLIDSSKDIDNSRLFGVNRNTEEFFESNIKSGMDMDAVFKLVGRAYLYEENGDEVLFTYFVDGGAKKAVLTFEGDILKNISFEDAEDEKVVELKLWPRESD